MSVVTTTKNMGVAIILTVLLGPLGMFYSTIGGGFFMTIVSLIVVIPLFIISPLLAAIPIIVFWPICIIWAAVAVSRFNKKLLRGSGGGRRRYF